MKIMCVLPIVAAISGPLAAAAPAAAADLPGTRPAYGDVAPPTPRIRVFQTPGCRIGTERFWDGYAWRSRSIQVCS